MVGITGSKVILIGSRRFILQESVIQINYSFSHLWKIPAGNGEEQEAAAAGERLQAGHRRGRCKEAERTHYGS